MTKEWAGRPVYAVSEIVAILSTELEQAFPDVWVEGEVSGFKRAASGHCYFTLKDGRAALKVVLFRTHAVRIAFAVENGMVVMARGKLSVYEASGDLQLYATILEPAGLGALQMAFEQSKRRLMEEGLTDPARKRPLPPFPSRVGVVTSLQGAALRDVLSVFRRRGARFDVVISPALVQGAAAPKSIENALERLMRTRGIEVILLTRGGGSMEDLWAFNDESLARMVAACPVPTISAVGHEVDTVLTDLTADVRAPTPSVAAELLTARTEAVLSAAADGRRRLEHLMRSRLLLARERLHRCLPQRQGQLMLRRLQTLEQGADRAAERALSTIRERLLQKVHRLQLCARALSPEAIRRWVETGRDRVATASRRLEAAQMHLLEREQGRFESQVRLLQSLSPLGVLARGYSAAFDERSSPITDAAAAPVGSVVSIALKRGGLDCTVTSQSPTHLPGVLSGWRGRAIDEGEREP